MIVVWIIIFLIIIIIIYYFYCNRKIISTEYSIIANKIIFDCYNINDINITVYKNDYFSYDKQNNSITIDSDCKHSVILYKLGIQIAYLICKKYNYTFLSVNEKIQSYLIVNYKI